MSIDNLEAIYEVKHHSEMIDEMLEEGKIELTKIRKRIRLLITILAILAGIMAFMIRQEIH